MKIFLIVSSIFFFTSCSTSADRAKWDGAQRQDVMKEETQTEQQDQQRNQFPTQGTSF